MRPSYKKRLKLTGIYLSYNADRLIIEDDSNCCSVASGALYDLIDLSFSLPVTLFSLFSPCCNTKMVYFKHFVCSILFHS